MIDNNLLIFLFIILLIIIFFSLKSNKCSVEQFSQKVDMNSLGINEFYVKLNNNRNNYIQNQELIVLGNSLVNYDLKENDILQLQMKTKQYENIGTEDIYIRLKTEPNYYTSNVSLNFDYSGEDLSFKFYNNYFKYINDSEKSQNIYCKFKITKIGNTEDNCIFDKHIKLQRDKDSKKYTISFTFDKEKNDSLKKEYFDKFKPNNVVSITNTNMPFTNQNTNKFLVEKCNSNYTITLQDNSNSFPEINIDENNQNKILLVRLDLDKIIQNHYNELSNPLGELAYLDFEIKNLQHKVKSINQNVKRFINNQEQKEKENSE